MDSKLQIQMASSGYTELRLRLVEPNKSMLALISTEDGYPVLDVMDLIVKNHIRRTTEERLLHTHITMIAQQPELTLLVARSKPGHSRGM